MGCMSQRSIELYALGRGWPGLRVHPNSRGVPSLLSNQFKLCLGGDVHPVTDFSAVADIASSMPWGLKRFHESHQLRRGERASWNPSYSERAPTRRKSPPNRSLDGPRSRVEMRVLSWATRPESRFSRGVKIPTLRKPRRAGHPTSAYLSMISCSNSELTISRISWRFSATCCACCLPPMILSRTASPFAVKPSMAA